MRASVIVRSTVLLGLLAALQPVAAVPFEARPPHVRQGPMMSDPTFIDAVSDARLREIVGDIEAGRSEIAKRKLVLFLQAVPGSIQAIEILGTLLQNEGNFEQAEMLLRQGVAAAPEQVSMRARLGVTLLNRQKYAEAAPHLQYAVEREPDNALALTNYGWLLAIMERDRQAMEIYERLLDPKFERQIDRTELFFGLAILYARLDEHDKAIALLEPEFGNVSAPHENNRVFLNLAEAYRSTGRLDDAARTLDRLETLIPGTPVGLVLARARLAAARDDFNGGAAMLARALTTHPDAHADIHLTLARLEMDRKYHRRAADAFAKAVEAAPGEDRPAILSEMTKSFAAAERSADVTSILERFATVGGQDAAISLLLAENLVQSGRKRDALSLLERQIAANPGLAQAHLLKAVVLRGDSRVAEARQAMRASVEADPANPAAWHLLADLTHDTDGDAAMLAVFKEGVGHNPTDPHLLLGAGSIAYSQGDVAYAAEIFARLVARYPDDPMALSNAALAYLDLDRNVDQARMLLEKALERAPRVPAIVDTWGWMLHKTGKSAEAIELFERVAQVLPGDGGVSYHLGIAYEATGQDGLGRAALRRALALGVPQHYREDIVRRLSAK